jgi:hypothetical protein
VSVLESFTWDQQMDPYTTYRVQPASVSPSSIPGAARSAGPGAFDAAAAKLWHPDNPLFWFGVIAAATFGLVAGSTSIKVGPFRASAGVGST